LANFIDNEDDVLLAGFAANEFDHFSRPGNLGLADVERDILEVFRLREELGINSGSQACRDGVGYEGLIVDLAPFSAI
jgi:hypothetical protein